MTLSQAPAKRIDMLLKEKGHIAISIIQKIGCAAIDHKQHKTYEKQFGEHSFALPDRAGIRHESAGIFRLAFVFAGEYSRLT